MTRIFTLAVVFMLGIVRFASPLAVFEVDLLHYEALPNKCCDGFRNVHFGPLKCNECDPYFNICLRSMPSGPNQCVKTTRENNIHTQDLTNGNIQPNHLSMSMQKWQGSMVVDVDIKDFDSVGKDDDIDHLIYTYHGAADPSSQTVVINGTKVRLTIAIRIYCSTNYFGHDCNQYCLNGSYSYCDQNGTSQCKPGYIGVPPCVPVTHSTQHFTELSVLTTSVAPASDTPVVSSMKVTSPTEHPTTDSSDAVSSSQSKSVSPLVMTIQHEHSTDINVNRGSNPGTKQTEDTTSVLTKGPTVVTNPPMVNTESQRVLVSVATTADVSAWPRGDNTTEEIVTEERTTVSSSPMGVSSTTPKFNIPEPIELYSCNILVQGHMAGVHTQVVSVLYTAFSAHPRFVQNSLLGVNAIASTFEVTDNGQAVTDVSYVVNYNGEILRSDSVLQILTQLPSSRVLDEQLTANNIHRYSPTALAGTSSPSNTPKKWVTRHLPFVIVMSCLITILLGISTLLAVRRLRKTHGVVLSNGSSGLYDKTSKPSDRQNYDLAFSMENPLYDFDSNQQPSSYKMSFA